MIVGVSDKLMMPWLKGKKYLDCSDEGEAVGIGMGLYLATGKPATVFMSADGFMNALNPITSEVIPRNIKMNIIISIGRKESQHIIATDLVPKIIKELNEIPSSIHFKLIEKKS